MRKKQADAKKMGNTSAVADYEDAIKLQQKAFEEERRREQQQREQERLEQERQAREQAQEQARQQREAQQRQAQQRQTLSTPSSVNLNLDVDEMASILQARDENVANQALNNLMKQMQDATKRST